MFDFLKKLQRLNDTKQNLDQGHITVKVGIFKLAEGNALRFSLYGLILFRIFLVTIIKLHKFSKVTMPSLKKRTRTQISQAVYIPPLRLPEYIQNSPKHQKTKESLTFLQPVPLDQNQQFLKQKSLYRYTISRKLNRFQNNRSVSNLIMNTSSLENSRLKDQAPQMKRSKSKEGSHLSKKQQTQEEKQRHFKRKNRNLIQKPSLQLFSNLMSSPSQQNKSNKNNQIISKDQKEEAFLETVEKLKSNNQKLTKQNLSMKVLLAQKNKELGRYQQQIEILKRQKQKLIHEAQRNLIVHSQSFINDQKIENQLRFRDTIINQLQSSIKYIQLENFTLKKAKNQCIRQKDLIRNLQNQKKQLQEKVKKLYRQKSKRRNRKGSLISEWSELSLNLSFDQEDSDKYLEGLKTSQRTPEKAKQIEDYNSFPKTGQPKELISAGWKVKKTKK